MIIVFGVISMTLAVIAFLVSRRCQHTWQNVDEFSNGKYRIYVQRCSKCGTLRTRKLRVK